MPELIRQHVLRVQQLTLPVYILAFGAALILFNIVFSVSVLAAERIFDTGLVTGSTFSRHGFWYKLIAGCVLAPVLETYMFQHLPYRYLRKRRFSKALIIVISSLLFGIVHYYDWIYIIRATLAGGILISAYILKPSASVSGLVTVSAVHAINNVFTLLIESL
ncbi:MAG TPA: CPBP family intramembrane glutamic endopeptidase [Sphingobacteriaceae bacterium]